eukprot:jgi/Ulvmu1/3235/UM150_0006.1
MASVGFTTEAPAAGWRLVCASASPAATRLHDMPACCTVLDRVYVHSDVTPLGQGNQGQARLVASSLAAVLQHADRVHETLRASPFASSERRLNSSPRSTSTVCLHAASAPGISSVLWSRNKPSPPLGQDTKKAR